MDVDLTDTCRLYEGYSISIKLGPPIPKGTSRRSSEELVQVVGAPGAKKDMTGFRIQLYLKVLLVYFLVEKIETWKVLRRLMWTRQRAGG